MLVSFSNNPRAVAKDTPSLEETVWIVTIG